MLSYMLYLQCKHLLCFCINYTTKKYLQWNSMMFRTENVSVFTMI